MHILVVDDHELTRFGLKIALQCHSSVESVGVASNGREAVEIAAASHPDVIILDLQMPVMDGASASRQIKRIDSRIKIIGYSSVQSAQAKDLLNAAKLDAFCDKSTCPLELVGLAQKLLQKLNSS